MRVYSTRAITDRGRLLHAGTPLDLLFLPTDPGTDWVRVPGESVGFPVLPCEWDLVPPGQEEFHAQA